MKFKSFQWLCHHDIMSHYTMFYKYGKRPRVRLFIFILVGSFSLSLY